MNEEIEGLRAELAELKAKLAFKTEEYNRMMQAAGPKLVKAGELLEAWFHRHPDFLGCPTLPSAQYLKWLGEMFIEATNKSEVPHA